MHYAVQIGTSGRCCRQVSFALDPFQRFSGRQVLVHLNRGNGDIVEDLGSVTTLLSRRFLVKQNIQCYSIQYLTIYDNICWHIGKTKASGCACWSLLPCPTGQFRFASCVLVILNWSSVVFCGFGSSGTLLQLGFPPHPLLSACVWVHARERSARERERYISIKVCERSATQ